MEVKSDWIKTKQMAQVLGCSRETLSRLKSAGYFKEGRNGHYRKINPLAPRGDFVWHETRTKLRMDAE